ncbi:AfsR/SARP family transcriptional regulator [Spirillospora sp. NPDC048819]|uniref:AfsR/SARP family transcriptional regulator n=1 Tax=Spirillospora sp. NPDC048819 TaxID=3155268 RepID=UPI0033FC6EF5
MQQTLLSSLLVCGGSVVTVDSLMEELWGTTPPVKAENALQAQISRLRRRLAQLEPGRAEPRLTTRAAGYLFEVDRAELDAWIFLDTVDAVRGRMPEDKSEAASQADIARLRTALGLWRGPALGGLTGGPMCQTAVNKLNEARNAALCLLYEIELKFGGHMRIIPELSEVCTQNPMQEQFCLLSMIALYRSGRQTDALEVYRRFRRRLAEQLGIEPSPALARYERAILTHDPLMLTDEPSLSIYSTVG